MKRPNLTRETLLPRLAAHVLAHGLGAASLRPLAKAAGTSDRMLIYHFANKEQLIVDLLAFLAEQYAQLLDTSFVGNPAATRKEFLSRILASSEQPDAQPYVTLWWEIVAGSARDLPGFRAASYSVMQRLLEWIEEHMPEGDPDPAGGARYLLTMVEGSQMLRAVGHRDIATAGIAAMPASR